MLDTSSLITALRSSQGAAAEVLRRIFTKELVILMDYKLICEYRDVSLRPEHLMASKISSNKVLELIETLEEIAESVDVKAKVRPLSPDPDDDMVLDVAMNGLADVLVTQNVRHFATAAKRFHISVLTPAELLQRMRTGEADGN